MDSSSDGAYGMCFRAGEGPVWAAYGGGYTTPTAWMPMGPVHGQTYVNETGGGFIYTGIYDGTNTRVLIIRNPHPVWGKLSGALSAGDPATPSTFSFNIWLKSGAVWPYTQAVATDTPLLGLTGVNRSPGTSAASGRVIIVGWSDELLEYYPLWVDCAP